MGAVAVGATIYFGSDESTRQIVEVSEAFADAHELGMATMLWCYLRNSDLQDGDKRLPRRGRPDRPGESPRRDDPGRHHQAEAARRTTAATTRSTESSYGKTAQEGLRRTDASDHPIDLCRYQVANCYMGRCGLINSGGESKGASDLAEAVRTAVINKRAGGMGLISGRKAFQRPMEEGVELLNAIQDVYLDKRSPSREGPGGYGRTSLAGSVGVVEKIQQAAHLALPGRLVGGGVGIRVAPRVRRELALRIAAPWTGWRPDVRRRAGFEIACHRRASGRSGASRSSTTHRNSDKHHRGRAPDLFALDCDRGDVLRSGRRNRPPGLRQCSRAAKRIDSGIDDASYLRRRRRQLLMPGRDTNDRMQ